MATPASSPRKSGAGFARLRGASIRALERRRARVLLVLLPVGLLATFGGLHLLLRMKAIEVALASELAHRVAERSKVAVRMDGFHFGPLFQPCADSVVLYRVAGELEVSATAERACVDRWASALGSGFRTVQVEVRKPSLVLAGLGAPGQAAPLVDVKPNAPALLRLPERKSRAPLNEIAIEFGDLTLDWRDLPLPSQFASGSLGPLDGALRLQQRARDSAISLELARPKVWSLTGRASPTEEGFDLSFHLDGDLAATLGEYLTSFGIDLRRLPVRGELGAVYSRARRTLVANVDLEEVDADVASSLVSSKRLAVFAARERARILIDLAQGRFAIQEGVIEVNGIRVEFSLDVRGGTPAPVFVLSAELKTLPLRKLLEAIPGGDRPDFVRSMSSSLLFALSFTIGGQLKDPLTWEPKLEHRFVMAGAASGEAVPPEDSGLAYLLGPFRYHPLTDSGRRAEAIETGPGTRRWLKFHAVPYALKRAVQVAEDANFFLHRGIDVGELRAAIHQGMTSGERARGGSTLTQQLAKNLFLSRDRTAQRKVQEVILSLLLEDVLDKNFLFELYLNLIEWGPNLFGLSDASEHYFGRRPEELSIKQMAYLASIIPAPIPYHEHYERGFVPPSHQTRIERILERLRKVETINDFEYHVALAEPIRFRKRGAAREVVP